MQLRYRTIRHIRHFCQRYVCQVNYRKETLTNTDNLCRQLGIVSFYSTYVSFKESFRLMK
jgi:hypothetical protein